LEVCGSKPGEEIQLPVNRTLTIGKQFGKMFFKAIYLQTISFYCLIFTVAFSHFKETTFNHSITVFGTHM
jgi:hypothetical protein